MVQITRWLICLLLIAALSACGFHMQGEVALAPPLKRLYVQTSDPYGVLARNLEQALKMSHVKLMSRPEDAQTILAILHDDTAQDLLSVSGTQQTRQYNLKVTVIFQVTDSHGRVLMDPQSLTETRGITIQSNQILGSSNEATLYFQQMRRALAYAIMNRLASKDLTQAINRMFTQKRNPIKP